MSFFFLKKAPEVKRAAVHVGMQPPSIKVKAQAATLNRLGCTACPLNHAPVTTPKMAPTLVKGTKVYFLAEAPGRHEDEESGKPLTGPSGSLLRECIPNGEDAHCSFDNVVRDRPPKNRTPTWPEIECCRGHVTKSIEQAKPKLIVGLGAVPLSWMLNSGDLAGMRGRIFAVKVGSHPCWFMPTYHPSFILRTAYDKKKPLNSKLGHCFRMDVKHAFNWCATALNSRVDDLSDIRSNIICFDGTEDDHYLTLLSLINKAAKAPIKAIDLETKGLRPYSTGAAIMSAAISFDDTNFAFALDHPRAGWSRNKYTAILVSLERLLKDDTIKVAHNAPFEIEWLIWRLGLGVVNHAAWQCTQMQAHFLDERRGKKATGGDDHRRSTYQSLDFLCKQHFGVAFKSTFKLDKKDMSKSDLGEMLIYNAVDTKYTLRLYHTQAKALKKLGLTDAYLDALPRQATVAMMQYLGVNVDQREVKKLQGRLEGEIAALMQSINSLKVVKAYVADHKEFNPGGQDVIAIFRDYLKRPEVSILEESGKTRFSVDKNVLDKIDHPLAQLLVELRNKSKMKSTYVDILELGVGEQVYPDGMIHCNFNTTFAETGRTSADAPNMQNFPQRKDAWVRKQVVAPKGQLLVAFDYGQLEACTAAMCSRDKVLVQALRDDYDIHAEWAVKTADRYPAIVGGKDAMRDPKVAKAFRSRIKNKLVFPAIFGAQSSSIAGYLSMPEDIIDDLMNEFWRTFSGLKAWQDKLMKGYYKVGYVESPTGRRHHYPLTRNQAINHPVQCLAAEIVCDAMCRLSYEAATTGQWHLHPRLNIHDDLTFVIPDDDTLLEGAIDKISKTMLTPPYKCVNVPLSVSVSVGKNWYEMSEVAKLWSHKDV